MTENNYQGIYKILSRKTGRFYIGSSKNIGKRFKQHLRELKNGTHHSHKLQDEFDLYGGHNLTIQTIEIINDEKYLELREQYWIDTLQACKDGFNISPFSDRPRPLTPQEIKALSDARLNMPYKKIPLPSKSGKIPKHTLGNMIKSVFINVDKRTEFEKLCDMAVARLAVFDGSKILVEFYQYDCEVDINLSSDQPVKYTEKYKMVDPDTKQIICEIQGEETIRRWLRQNSVEDLRNFHATVGGWLKKDIEQQSLSRLIARRQSFYNTYFKV